MKTRVLFFLISFIIIVFVSFAIVRKVHADMPGKIETTLVKITKPTWLEDRSIKWGLMSTFCIAQGTTSLIESAKYGGLYLSNSADDYHVYRMLQNAAWLGTGWFSYAVIKQENKTWWSKVCRITGAACYARDANELVYRWNVTGSPFNYSDKYTSNKKAIVLLKWDCEKGKFVDFYISGAGKQGALIDISFAVVGLIFNHFGDIR